MINQVTSLINSVLCFFLQPFIIAIMYKSLYECWQSVNRENCKNVSNDVSFVYMNIYTKTYSIEFASVSTTTPQSREKLQNIKNNLTIIITVQVKTTSFNLKLSHYSCRVSGVQRSSYLNTTKLRELGEMKNGISKLTKTNI